MKRNLSIFYLLTILVIPQVCLSKNLFYSATKWVDYTKYPNNWAKAMENPISELVEIRQTEKTFTIHFGKKKLIYNIISYSNFSESRTDYILKEQNKIQTLSICEGKNQQGENVTFLNMEKQWSIPKIDKIVDLSNLNLSGLRHFRCQPQIKNETTLSLSSQVGADSASVKEYFINEAYDRLKFIVNAFHILVNCKIDADPADTLKSYNRALSLRNRIIAGERFDELAAIYSDEPTAKSNFGNLNYFTTLAMVYPFENVVFSLKEGQISLPIRTKFGYHLILLNDKVENPGEVKVRHIMLKYNKATSNPTDSLEKWNKISEIFSKLKEGHNFENLALEFSMDRPSAKKGGELPMFSVGRMLPEFEKVAFSLKKVGDFSEPFLTPYGWHIVQLIDKKIIGTIEEVKKELEAKLINDSRFKDRFKK